MALLVGIPGLLAEFGVGPETVLAGLPLLPSVFDDPETRIPYDLACLLLHRCVEITGCPHFPLLLGTRSDVRVLGLAGQWMANAPSLGAALSGLVAMQPSASRGGVTFCFVTEDAVQLGYGVYAKRSPGWQHAYPLCLAFASRIVRDLTARAIEPIEVLLSIPEPPDRRPYQDVFKAPIRFNQPLSALTYARSVLDLPIPGASPVSLRALEQRAAALMPPTPLVWTDRVRRILRSLIMEADPVIPVVAERLRLSTRTLRRHLAREGTTFQAILDEHRFANACELLELTDLPIGEISLALAYATHSAFDNAFRRWSGTSPQRWRATARSTLAGLAAGTPDTP